MADTRQLTVVVAVAVLGFLAGMAIPRPPTSCIFDRYSDFIGTPIDPTDEPIRCPTEEARWWQAWMTQVATPGETPIVLRGVTPAPTAWDGSRGGKGGTPDGH